MKVLKLKQPWAHLVCSGVCDVVSVNCNYNYRGVVLIAAYDLDTNRENWYYEWATQIDNTILFGNIPDNFDCTHNKIIGCIEVNGSSNETYSVWQEDDALNRKYMKVKKPQLFNEPIPLINNNDKLFFDYNEIESIDNIESYSTELRNPMLSNSKYIIPTSDNNFSLYTEGKHDTINIKLSDDIIVSGLLDLSTITDTSCDFIPINEIELKSPTKSALFDLASIDLTCNFDKDGNITSHISKYNNIRTSVEMVSIKLGRLKMWF